MTRQGGRSGLFIVLEGVDGSGKSTQVGSASGVLLARGRDALETREPGATPLGAGIRELVLSGSLDVDPWAEVLLYAADRAQHVADVIRPALESGRDVVSDRFLWSSLAYQGAGRELGIDRVSQANVRAVQGVQPDLVIVLDVPCEVGRSRLDGGHDRIESAPREFHERVREAFLELARDSGSPVIDASRAVDVVSKEVRALVTALLEARSSD